MPKPLPTPLEYRRLPKKDRMNKWCHMFFWKISESPKFVNKRLSPDFCKVRTFINRQEDYVSNLLYDYMWSIERTPMDMTQLFISADKWNTEQRFKGNVPTVPLPEYESISDILKRDLGINF